MRTFILVLSLMAPLLAQQTVVVSGGGPALKLAIGKASPGDTIIVNHGVYDFFTASIGVRILCDRGVELKASPLLNYLKISSLPAGQSFVLVGSLSSKALISGGQLAVENCKGDVSFSRVTGPETLYLSVSGSDSVSFHRCRMSRMHLSGSKVLFSDCLFMSTEAIGSVLLCRTSEVDFNNSVISAIALPGARVATPAYISGSLLRLSGHSRLETSPLHAGVPALNAISSTVTLSPSVVLTSGTASPINRIGSSVVTDSIPACSVIFDRTYLKLSVTGDPQLSTALFLSGVTGPRPLTNFGGLLWFDTTAPANIAIPLPASGAWLSWVALPSGLPRGLQLTVQALSLSNKILVGGAARVVLN